jgi:hypothetical protein
MTAALWPFGGAFATKFPLHGRNIGMTLWINSRQEAARPIANGGFTMIRNGPTRRKRGDIWPHLGVSACVLLLPPLVMAAGVMVLGSSPPKGTEPEGAAQQAAPSQTTVTKSVNLAERSDMRPDGGTSFALASAEQHFAITEQHPIAEESPATKKPAASEQSPVSGQPRNAKDSSRYDTPVPLTASGQPAATNPSRYYGPIPVTLIHVRKSSERTAMVDIEAAPSSVRAGYASPAAMRIHAAHTSRRMGRHEPRSVYRVKQERARSLNEPRRMAGVAGPAGAGAGVRRAQRAVVSKPKG